MLLVNKLCYFVKQDSSFGYSVNLISCSYGKVSWNDLESFCWKTCDLRGVFPRPVWSTEKQKKYKLQVSFRNDRFLYGHSNFNVFLAPKSSPENKTKLSCSALLLWLNLQPTFYSLMPIDPCKNWKKNKRRYSHFAFDNPHHVYGFATKLPRNTRGNTIHGNSTPLKSNLRGIRMGIGPIWGINSFAPLSSLQKTYLIKTSTKK